LHKYVLYTEYFLQSQGYSVSRITKFSWVIGILMVVSQVQAAGQLYDFSGKASSIDDFTGKGKWTIVMMWASDCHVCNAEAHAYNDFHEWHKDKGAVVLGISLDGKDKKPDAERFIEEHSLSFRNLIGEGETVASIYSGLTGQPWIGTPTFLIYAPDGKLMAQQVGAVPTDLIENFMAKHASKYSSIEPVSNSTEQ
jgi:peroxiredoxin